MPATAHKQLSELVSTIGTDRVNEVLAWDHGELISRSVEDLELDLAAFLRACFEKPHHEIDAREWELFCEWHESTQKDESVDSIFQIFGRQIEESVELFFMDLASASETCSGDYFNDDTHDSFYLASREVNRQGIRVQLEFLKDNAPSDYQRFLDAAGLNFVLPRGV